MKGGKQPLGYTIAEVMIVLAISGVMFVIAATFINGKQQRTAFREGVYEYATDIQQVIDDVSDGQFSGTPLNCTVSQSSGHYSLSTSLSTDSTNFAADTNCTYAGKFIDLAGAGQTPYAVIETLVAARIDPATHLPFTTYTDDTKAPYPAVAVGNGFDLDVNLSVPDNLLLTSSNGVVINGSHGTEVSNNGVGFMVGLGHSQPITGNNTTFASGAQSVGMYADNYTLDQSHPLADYSIGTSGLHAITSFKMCLTDGTEVASLSIGDQGQLRVNTQIGDSSCPTS